eukprot:TRINITY_DN6048_c0_g1_i8.p3 TRINITY_DN6048_c0_g1~~TRINITY_DN6048_c0_g1_i8.p3  ORF type:complete len:134 (+),score=3.38 TRINITY_DN6048_c0_g1_i8:499-900(+)
MNKILSVKKQKKYNYDNYVQFQNSFDGSTSSPKIQQLFNKQKKFQLIHKKQLIFQQNQKNSTIIIVLLLLQLYYYNYYYYYNQIFSIHHRNKNVTTSYSSYKTLKPNFHIPQPPQKNSQKQYRTPHPLKNIFV